MADTFVPTDEQLAVIAADEARLVVTAAAGAGKTWVLVERYMRHVEQQGLRPDQILTITFTKKAAAQMKERIVKALREKGLDDAAQIAETGPIQTIHSFCERLLRENALEAGLDPNFEILTEAQTTRLVTGCIREVLAAPFDEEPNAEGLVSFLAGKIQAFGDNRGPYARLEGSVVKVLSELRGSGLLREDVAEWHRNPSTLKAHWEESIMATVSVAVKHACAQADAQTLQERLQIAFKATGEKAPAYIKGKPDLEAEEVALAHSCGLAQLAVAAWWRLDRQMNELQALDFSGLEERAVRLMERSEVTRERVRNQYRVVMVDEAQDVNPVQHRLLDNLHSSLTMMVGDAQQSIYGFRQADVGLFRERASRDGAKRLTKNHRSKPGILNLVDTVFGLQWGEDYVPMNASTEPLDLNDDSPTSFDCVELWNLEKKDLTGVARFAAELLTENLHARDLAFLVRDGEGALAVRNVLESVGIEARIAGGTQRFYTRIEVRDLANALRSVADQGDDFALLACLRSPMCGLSLDSIAVLGKQGGVAEALAGFEPPLESDSEKLQEFLGWYVPLSKYADRLSAWEVLSEIFARSPYLAALARRSNRMQLLANARKLLSLATQEPELGPMEYADRIREIQELRHKEGDAPAGEEDADVATIMTVHKAKGLEFPVVVLCQTDRSLNRAAQDLVIDPRHKMIVTKFGTSASLAHKFATAMKKDRDYAEELRVLYVALTRAQKRLCVSIYVPGNQKSVSSILVGALGASQPPGARVRDGRIPASS